jgi:hypothetical protein
VSPAVQRSSERHRCGAGSCCRWTSSPWLPVSLNRVLESHPHVSVEDASSPAHRVRCWGEVPGLTTVGSIAPPSVVTRSSSNPREPLPGGGGPTSSVVKVLGPRHPVDRCPPGSPQRQPVALEPSMHAQTCQEVCVEFLTIHEESRSRDVGMCPIV